jgi:hypothetical protein
MTPLQMAQEAVKALAQPSQCGVLLTIPHGKMLRGFPRGELLNEMERHGRVERTYSFEPIKIIEWLVSNELVVMEVDGNKVKFSESKKGDTP